MDYVMISMIFIAPVTLITFLELLDNRKNFKESKHEDFLRDISRLERELGMELLPVPPKGSAGGSHEACCDHEHIVNGEGQTVKTICIKKQH